MVNLQLPAPSSLVSQILKAKVYDPKMKKYRKIQQYMKEDIDDAQHIRTNKLQDQKFAHFVCDLLRRGQGTIFEQEREERFHQRFRLSKIPDFDVREIKLKRKGTSGKTVALLSKKCDGKELNFLLDLVEKYRWGKGIAAFAIIGAKYVIMHEYGGFENYLKVADNQYENDFRDDKLLSENEGVTYIGPKVRDLALSSFLDNYLAVDQFIKAALLRTGMLSYMYKYGIRIKSMDDYWEVRNICVRLAKSARLSPHEFDRILWHFVGKYCNPLFSQNCKYCRVSLCLSHP